MHRPQQHLITQIQMFKKMKKRQQFFSLSHSMTFHFFLRVCCSTGFLTVANKNEQKRSKAKAWETVSIDRYTMGVSHSVNICSIHSTRARYRIELITIPVCINQVEQDFLVYQLQTLARWRQQHEWKKMTATAEFKKKIVTFFFSWTISACACDYFFKSLIVRTCISFFDFSSFPRIQKHFTPS